MPADQNDAPDAFQKAVLDRLDAIIELLMERDRRPAQDDNPVERLRTAAIDMGLRVSVDGFVREFDAARLIGRSPSTLRNWRCQHQPIPYRRLGGRTEYRLDDIAQFLERAEWEEW